jgi:NAD(P)-dependent dehydrogenase (short-subunit alcohol dehydrogenase family)
MPSVIITGANRGLGLEFARQYREAGWDVIATVRETSRDLEDTGALVTSLDMHDVAAVEQFGKGIKRLDLLIANAGTYGPRDVPDAASATEWSETFVTNTIAPYLLAKCLLPAAGAAGGKLIAISTRMGSIEDNTSGGFIAYRSSKSALNSAWRSLAMDNRGKVTCAVLHPGWVQTRMGGSAAPLEPEESVSGMRRVIENLRPDQSGEFFSYDGTIVPW